ncbi:NAD-binding protein [Phaeacidiphilus oryzae]|uniref:NAD-binding protein n=1 Tax=Phaeacidiphilus oryzae TaxID=348818 RepID=UPI00069064D3|nr:NAD-binding protein [Phaeacidiphilus oryzae]
MTAPTGHMIVCGNDPLTHRLALDLVHLYNERVVLIVPAPESLHGPQLIQLADENPDTVRVVEGRAPDEEALKAAGIASAAALALTMDDDQETIHAALLARGLNPRIRLVLQIFDRTLGRRVKSLLDRAAERTLHLPPVGTPGAAAAGLDGPDAYPSTAILSASATAAPALVAAALPRHRHLIPVDGGMLTVNQFHPGERPPPRDQTIALLLSRPHADSATPAPRLLPDDDEAREALRAGSAVRAALTVSHSATAQPPRGRLAFPLGALFPRRLRLAAAAFAVVVVVLAAANWLFAGASPGGALYRVLMDVADMSNPENGASPARKLLQLLAAYTGMAITPLILALVLDALGALGTTFRHPPRRMTGHVILIGLGKIGTRVLDRLTSLGVPVVCIERDPKARGLQLARRRQVPVVVGDVSFPEVYEQARIGRSSTVLALTSDDRVNLEAVLYARDRHPAVGVVLRLFDDEFASTVYRALRAGDPPQLAAVQREDRPTVSRSVSFLAAPAFSAAMLGRQVLASIPVERQVLLVAVVDVHGQPELGGRTVRQAFRPGGWRVIGIVSGSDRRRPLDGSGPEAEGDTLGRGVALRRRRRRSLLPAGLRRAQGAGAAPGPEEPGAEEGRPVVDWQPSPDERLQEDQRVVVIATREGLGHLLQRRGADGRTTAPSATPPQPASSERAPAPEQAPVPEQPGPAAEPVPATTAAVAPATGAASERAPERAPTAPVVAAPAAVSDPRLGAWGAGPGPGARTSPTQPLGGAGAGTGARTGAPRPEPDAESAPASAAAQAPAAAPASAAQQPRPARRSRFRHSEGSSAVLSGGRQSQRPPQPQPRPQAAEAEHAQPSDAVPAAFAGAPSRAEREEIGDQPTVPLPQAPRALPSAPYRPGERLRRARRRAPEDAEHPFAAAEAEEEQTATAPPPPSDAEPGGARGEDRPEAAAP